MQSHIALVSDLERIQESTRNEYVCNAAVNSASPALLDQWTEAVWLLRGARWCLHAAAVPRWTKVDSFKPEAQAIMLFIFAVSLTELLALNQSTRQGV